MRFRLSVGDFTLCEFAVLEYDDPPPTHYHATEPTDFHDLSTDHPIGFRADEEAVDARHDPVDD